MAGKVRWSNKQLVFRLVTAGVLFRIIEGFLGFRDEIPDVLILAEVVTINVILFYWVMRDSKIREYATSVFLKVLALIFGVPASFYYVARNRGLVPGFLSFLYTVVLIILMFALVDLSRALTEALVRQLV